MKKNIAKLTALMMVLTMGAAAGCSNSSTNATSTGNESSKEGTVSAEAENKGIRKFEGTTLYMIAEQQTPTVALQSQLPAFEELTGIHVDLQMAPFDDVVQKETLAFESKSGTYEDRKSVV